MIAGAAVGSSVIQYCRDSIDLLLWGLWGGSRQEVFSARAFVRPHGRSAPFGT